MPALMPLLLTGCGSSKPAPTVTIMFTATPKGTVELVPEPLRELRIGIGQAGLVCQNWRELSVTVGECDGRTLMSWAPNTRERLNLHKAAINISLNAITRDNRTDVDMLVGRNWFVRVLADAAPILHERVGGVIILGAVAGTVNGACEWTVDRPDTGLDEAEAQQALRERTGLAGQLNWLGWARTCYSVHHPRQGRGSNRQGAPTPMLC